MSFAGRGVVMVESAGRLAERRRNCEKKIKHKSIEWIENGIANEIPEEIPHEGKPCPQE